MLRSAKMKSASSSTLENLIQEFPAETIGKSSNTMINEGSCFTRFFQKVTCLSRQPADDEDESEILIIPKAGFK